MSQQTLIPPQQAQQQAQIPVSMPQAPQQPVHQQQRPVSLGLAPIQQQQQLIPEQKQQGTIWGPFLGAFAFGAFVGIIAFWKISNNKYFRAFQDADRYGD